MAASRPLLLLPALRPSVVLKRGLMLQVVATYAAPAKPLFALALIIPGLPGAQFLSALLLGRPALVSSAGAEPPLLLFGGGG